MAKSKPTILVTGGAGYIGSHVAKELFKNGYTPIAYDNLVYGHKRAVQWGPFVKGDIRDKKSLLKVIAKYRPKGVIHLAAFAYVGESVKEPAKYYSNNVAGTISLLEAMHETGVDAIVFSSTCATYGVPEKMPISEKTVQNPVNPYGASKLMIERMLADFSHAYGLKYAALRYFNAAGSDPEGMIGEDHDPETHLIPLVLDAAAGKLDHLTVFGDTYRTPDKTCVRDYIHVTDLARAHVLALKKLETGKASALRINLGTGKGSSIMEIIKAAEKVTGKKIKYVVAPPREGDPPVLVADASLAKKVLGWKAEFTDIKEVIGHAWNFRQNKKRFTTDLY